MRHITNDNSCARCSHVGESRIHALCDCTFSKAMWAITLRLVAVESAKYRSKSHTQKSTPIVGKGLSKVGS
ncbi:hypothetical protein PVK06_042873 [Gossypium arboreum]|uniref:Reverse transcriptase zinc-binding domain-containing protein n=1 Tax=Gossypium arboreum TaxID=29729 RepID=A0ABR0MLY3_GOSAR|nr:hypothetical protein PVK06_042873 [Gossypium arboreum]